MLNEEISVWYPGREVGMNLTSGEMFYLLGLRRIKSLLVVFISLKYHRKILKSKPELSHVFYLPCDSHGIQRLVKDIL